MHQQTEIDQLDFEQLLQPLTELVECKICPRECKANRFSRKLGYCNASADFYVSSICIHRGEEPPISGKKGICNIFFTNCNLQCCYCQNHQISFNTLNHSVDKMNLIEVLRQITTILNTGINSVGFVSPTHFIPQVKVIINALKSLGKQLTFVYNSNGYDKVEELKKLEGLIDVYLPDFKYMDPEVAKAYSEGDEYPQIAVNAIKEMNRQVGSTLHINNEGQAESGMIIRHLVLPGNTENSILVLREIAERISPEVSISLMSQYFPTYNVAGHKLLSRALRKSEYYVVVAEMKKLGMNNGWIQDMESHENYRPDFMREQPFE